MGIYMWGLILGVYTSTCFLLLHIFYEVLYRPEVSVYSTTYFGKGLDMSNIK